MNKFTATALVITAIAMAPTSAFASSDREEIEEACRQAAMDENVETVEIPDFIADCVEENLKAKEGEGAEEEEEEKESSDD